MECEEDEDVIFEGSQLHGHLINSEYSGPDINYYTSTRTSHALSFSEEKGCSWKTIQLSFKSKFGLDFTCHKEFGQKVVQCILDHSLVSIEDADFLMNMFDGLLSKENLSNIQSSASNFGIGAVGGAVLSVMLLSSPDVPRLLQVPSLLFIGWNVLLAFNQKISKLKKEELNLIVEKFQTSLSLLHELCSLMSKTLQFIQEMELIDRGFTLPNLVTHLSIKTLPNQPSALLCLPLRQELMDAVRHFHCLVRDRTLRIRKDLPLNGAVDNASHYMACQPDSPSPPSAAASDPITLPTIRACMRECHLQISEMLRRLALCFLMPTGLHHVAMISEINRELPLWIYPLKERLQTAYDYFAAWKVSDSGEEGNATTSPPESVRTTPTTVELALQSLERHLRATALILESNRGPPLVPLTAATRTQLSHECRAVSTCWELVELELNKLSGPKQAVSPTETSTETVRAPVFRPDENEGVQPLYGAWEPDLEDLEILEADIEKERAQMCEDDYDDMLLRETREERLARKREMAAQSKRLYSELQVVLRSKAAEWAEREAKVMERLGSPAQPVPPELGGPKEQVESDSPDVESEKDVTEDPSERKDTLPLEQNEPENPSLKFDVKSMSSSFTLQASLAAQVRALASQRTARHEDVIGDEYSDDDDADSATSRDSQGPASDH